MTLGNMFRKSLRRWFPRRPVIFQPSGKLPTANAPLMFEVTCGPGFNQTVPNAGVTYRNGLCHGFEELGIPYCLVSIFDLERSLADLTAPICFLSEFDYQYLSPASLRILKR